MIQSTVYYDVNTHSEHVNHSTSWRWEKRFGDSNHSEDRQLNW